MLIRVIRAFLVAGERQEPGSVVDLPDRVAGEGVWLGKAEHVSARPAPDPIDQEPDLPEPDDEVEVVIEAEPEPTRRRRRGRR